MRPLENGMSMTTDTTQNHPAPPADPTPGGTPPAETTERDALLVERRRWFRSFPHGPLEFVSTARMVWILGIVASPLVTPAQRFLGIVAVSVLLVADVGLAVWWALDLAMDRARWLGAGPVAMRDRARRRLLAAAAVVAAHGMLFVFLLTYMPTPVGSLRRMMDTVAMGRWVYVAAYLGLAVYSVLACQAAGLRGAGAGGRGRASIVLLPIPLVNWWTVRRLGRDCALDLVHRSGVPGDESLEASRAAVIVADVFWVAAMILLGGTLGVAIAGKHFVWPALCSGLTLAAAAVADVAAMESIQRTYLRFLRTAKTR